MGKGSSALASISQGMPRSSGKGGIASQQTPQSQSPQSQSPQSQYASPLAGLGAIFNSFQQPSPRQNPYISRSFEDSYQPQYQPQYEPQYQGYSGDSYIGGSPKFPEVFYPVPRTQPPPQYQQPNPYAAPFQQRYVQPTRLPPAEFVPKSAKDYRSPFQVSGKGMGRRGEQTYFNRPVETAPAPTPTPTPTLTERLLS